ncbi:MAG: acetylornithine deacetylase [Myxococcales bacterium]|nr:acetylornithine deacetylase [Myxococcales bacterium]USN50182.1 MAG: acetylornithine deacetylase [Myxococcales bacterium]
MGDLFTILADLIAFKTVSLSPNISLINYLRDFFSLLGFSTDIISHPHDPLRANLLCQIGPQVQGGLMLCGHTDVVPVSDQNWYSDPFIMTEQEGRFYGRGTTDMKGFIAATCVALSQLPLQKLSRPLSLLWTYDEEVGCQGSYHMAPLLKNYFKYLPEAALIGEPTDFRVLRMHAGHATVSIRVKGKGAHSSDPSLGVSAIKAMHQILTGIFALENELQQEKSLENHFKRPFVLLNVGEIHGGSAVNIIPDEASVRIGFRPLPNTSIPHIVHRIKERAYKSCTMKEVGITVTLENCAPAMMTKENIKLANILECYTTKGQEEAAAYATDAGNLCEYDIPCLIFGPGTIDIAHQANEWISINVLLQAREKIKGIVMDYCG